MSRYLTEEAANAAGFFIEHRPEEHRFVITQNDTTVGFAHYTLSRDTASEDTAIDFDSTVVDPRYRGTGLSGLLVKRAVGDDVAKGRKVRATCWFVAGYLKRHPEALAEGASYLG